MNSNYAKHTWELIDDCEQRIHKMIDMNEQDNSWENYDDDDAKKYELNMICTAREYLMEAALDLETAIKKLQYADQLWNTPF